MNEEIREDTIHEAHGDCIGCPDRLKCQKENNGEPRKETILEILENLQVWDEKFEALGIEMSEKLDIADFLVVAQIIVNKFGKYIESQKESVGGTIPLLAHPLMNEIISMRQLIRIVMGDNSCRS